MGLDAYPMIEKEFEGHMWKRMSHYPSFSLYGLSREEESFLHAIGFYHWLSEGCSGYTEVCIESVQQEIEFLRPEERFRIRYVLDVILQDIRENDGFYIQYNVG